MSSYGVHDFLHHAAGLERELRQALHESGKRQQAHQQRIGELKAQRNEALAQLVAVLLPEWSAAALQRAGRVAGFGPLLIPGETLGRLEAERAQLGERLGQIDTDRRYFQRDLLRAPRVGQLTREVDELEDFRKPMAELVARAAHPRLEALLASGYGSEAYQTPWWRASYYADWKAGDEILAQLGEKREFREVRPELVQARHDLAVYDQRLAELRAEIADGEALEAERNRCAARLASLERDHLLLWRQRLGQHIAALELAELGDRLQGEEAAQLLVKTFAGLGKKIEYLERVHIEQVLGFDNKLRAEIVKLQGDVAKFSRPKKRGLRFPADKFEKRFVGRRERFRKHWSRYDRTHDTVYEFHHYERASFVEDFLWWDLFTDGQIDGNFIPEVAEFHHHHPGYSWSGHHERDDDAAAAAAIQADTDSTFAALTDPS